MKLKNIIAAVVGIACAAFLALCGEGLHYAATNEPPLLPPTKLQSVAAAKTNAPVPRVELSGNSGSFDETSAIFGALAFARNPDVRDPKVIVEIARGLWQAQKRADAQRQTNAPGK